MEVASSKFSNYQLCIQLEIKFISINYVFSKSRSEFMKYDNAAKQHSNYRVDKEGDLSAFIFIIPLSPRYSHVHLSTSHVCCRGKVSSIKIQWLFWTPPDKTRLSNIQYFIYYDHRKVRSTLANFQLTNYTPYLSLIGELCVSTWLLHMQGGGRGIDTSWDEHTSCILTLCEVNPLLTSGSAHQGQ